MEKEKINVMGVELTRWTHKSCTADIGEGDDWATVYSVFSEEEGSGHAQELLLEAKKFYEDDGKVFGGSVALNPAMSHIYKKLGIREHSH